MIASSTQPAGIARERAQRDAERERHGGGDGADQQGDAGAVGDVGGDVPAEAVGAEPEPFLAGRREGRALHVPGGEREDDAAQWRP